MQLPPNAHLIGCFTLFFFCIHHGNKNTAGIGLCLQLPSMCIHCLQFPFYYIFSLMYLIYQQQNCLPAPIYLFLVSISANFLLFNFNLHIKKYIFNYFVFNTIKINLKNLNHICFCRITILFHLRISFKEWMNERKPWDGALGQILMSDWLFLLKHRYVYYSYTLL